MPALKVLVVGAIQGHLEKAFHKITKLHSKQNFSFAIVVGDVFASEGSEQSDNELRSLLNGRIQIPLPTYFTVGDWSLPAIVQEKLEANGEVCHNLLYLGRKGTLKTTEGIRIVTLGGRLVQNEASLTQAIGKYDPLYLELDARGLHGAHSAHILITNQWPANITKFSDMPVPETIDPGNSTSAIANLCSALKPRYHFSSSPLANWSREPFKHLQTYESNLEDEQQSSPVTRFTSLANVETSNKEWMSAFALDPEKPSSTEGAQRVSPLTLSPPPKKRSAPENSANGYSRYSRDQYHGNRRGNKRQKFDPNDCFMCMGRDGFRGEMVVSIAEESFITSLKGPLPIRGQTFPQLQSSCHVMIIPMYHAADEISSTKRTPSELETEFTEMNRYRHCLQQMLGSRGLGAVCWEVNRTGIRHFHWQLIGAPIPQLKNGLVEAAYKVAAENQGYPPFQPCDLDALIPGQRTDFFRVWIWTPTNADPPASSETNQSRKPKSPAEQAEAIANGQDDEEDNSKTPAHVEGTEKSMYFAIPSSQRFNISFGREVMAGLLQLEDRSDWRSIPDGGEDEDAEAFKQDFGKFDFAMQ